MRLMVKKKQFKTHNIMKAAIKYVLIWLLINIVAAFAAIAAGYI